MKKLFLKNKKQIAIYLLIKLFVGLLSLNIPISLFFISDALIQPNIDWVLIAILIVVMIVLTVLGALFGTLSYIFQNYLLHYVNVGILDLWLKDLVKKNYSEYNKYNPGHYYSIINNDIAKISNLGLLSFLDMINSIIVSIVFFLVIFIFNWVLGLIFLTFIFINLFLQHLFKNKGQTWNIKSQEALREYNQQLNNLITGYDLFFFNNFLKIFKEQILLRTQIWFQILIAKFNFNNKKTALFTLLETIFGIVITISSTVFVVHYTNVGLFNSFALIPFMFVFTSITKSELTQLYSNFYNYISGKKLYQELITKNFVKDKKIINTIKLEKLNLIKIEKLNINYAEKTIFQNFSLELQDTQKYYVNGENGSGKSTLLKAIAQLDKNYTGQILYNNQQVDKIDDLNLCKNLNYLSNDNFLFNTSILENIRLWDLKYSESDVQKILQQVYLDKDLSLNQMIDSKNTLSEGQKQRIDLARSLLRKPDFLIIDEGLSKIDPINLDKILNELLSDSKLTLILVYHKLSSKYLDKFHKIIEIEKIVNN